MDMQPPKHSLHKNYIILTVTLSILFGSLVLGSIFMFSKDNLPLGIIISALPIPFIFLYMLFKNPRMGFILVFYCNYFAVGMTRYIPAPVGLTVDIMLMLTLVAVIFSQFNHKVEWHLAAHDLTYIVLAWFLMTFMQLFNPEAVSRQAWFFVMRGYALYIFLAIPLTYIIFNKPKDFELFVSLCAIFTLLAILKGLQQKFIGVDRWEQQWLNIPGNRTTHILFGKLRVFSFYSDAGTYGGSMGYFGVLFIIMGMHELKKSKKRYYNIIGFLSLYAMMISGTRSAISVPLVGFILYTILTRRVKIMLFMGIIVFGVFFFFKYTTIGQGNYDIRRIRSGFDEDNASLNVRQENRKLFATYLATRPFGGGVGSAGSNGERFSPHTYLAHIPTDGWYIQIWAEEGIVGLIAYLLMTIYFLSKASFIIMFRLKNPKYIYPAIGFTSGMAGLMASSYTASSLGQMPNTIIVFVSIAFISLMPKWEQDEMKNHPINLTNT